MKRTRDQILAEVLELLNGVVQDWEFDAPLNGDTRLFADLKKRQIVQAKGSTLLIRNKAALKAMALTQ